MHRTKLFLITLMASFIACQAPGAQPSANAAKPPGLPKAATPATNKAAVPTVTASPRATASMAPARFPAKAAPAPPVKASTPAARSSHTPAMPTPTGASAPRGTAMRSSPTNGTALQCQQFQTATGQRYEFCYAPVELGPPRTPTLTSGPTGSTPRLGSDGIRPARSASAVKKSGVFPGEKHPPAQSAFAIPTQRVEAPEPIRNQVTKRPSTSFAPPRPGWSPAPKDNLTGRSGLVSSRDDKCIILTPREFALVDRRITVANYAALAPGIGTSIAHEARARAILIVAETGATSVKQTESMIRSNAQEAGFSTVMDAASPFSKSIARANTALNLVPFVDVPAQPMKQPKLELGGQCIKEVPRLSTRNTKDRVDNYEGYPRSIHKFYPGQEIGSTSLNNPGVRHVIRKDVLGR